MRIGQTSVVVFVSNVLASAIGFLGTVYFARTLGPEIIGIYATIVAAITWLQLTGKVGVHSALTKRLSEGSERGMYLTAGVTIVTVATLVTITALVVFNESVEAYVSNFGEYTDISVVWFLVVLLALQVTYHITNATLNGQHIVHVVGLLSPVRTGLINGIQFVLVYAFGFGLLGLIVGHTIGLGIAVLISITFVAVRPHLPSRKHFVSIYEYARYSWFGELSNRTFSNADILILGAFVPSHLVGIYSVSWALSSFLNLFGGAISSAIFPEISSVSAEADEVATAGLIQNTVAYAGFIVIPGVVGGALLDDRLLKIYGTGFGQGTEILWFHLLAALAYSYQSQFTTALNGLNRPDLVFRTNFIFILGNVILNVILISHIGWTGAAIASVTSTTLGLFISYYFVTRIVSIELPFGEIGKQVASALGMGIVVLGLKIVFPAETITRPNWLIVLIMVTIGAATYVGLLLLISDRFRDTIGRNLPNDLQM